MPAPLEFVRHPESTPSNPDITLPDTPTDDNDPTDCLNDDPLNCPDDDDPTSRILSTPRHSAWPD